MVVRGFFAGILSRIGIEDVEASLLTRIDNELEMSQEKP
jgi:hypothetical protein